MTDIPHICLKISISFSISTNYIQCTQSNIFICQLITVHLSKLPVQIMLLTQIHWAAKGLVPICFTFIFLKRNPPFSNRPPNTLENSFISPQDSHCHPCNCPAMCVEVTKMTTQLTPLHAFLSPFPISSAHCSQGNHVIPMPTALKSIQCKIKAITQRKPFISYLILLSLPHTHSSTTHTPHTPCL